MKRTQDRYPQILRNAYWLHVVAEVWADFRQLPDEINVLHAAPLLVHRSKSVKEQCNTYRSNDLRESTLQVCVPLLQPISTAQDCSQEKKRPNCAHHICSTCPLASSKFHRTSHRKLSLKKLGGPCQEFRVLSIFIHGKT